MIKGLLLVLVSFFITAIFLDETSLADPNTSDTKLTSTSSNTLNSEMTSAKLTSSKTSSLVKKNTSVKRKTSNSVKAKTSLNEQALSEVNKPVKLKTQENSTAEHTGFLSVHTKPIENEINPRSFPLGIGLSHFRSSGLIKTKKNSDFDLAQNSNPLMLNFILNYKQPENKVLSNLALNIGFQQSRQSLQAFESVLVSKSSLHLTAFKKIFQKDDFDFSVLTEIGFFQVQISNSENSLLNAYDKTNFLGLGGKGSYNLTAHIQLISELAYRTQILTSSQIEIDPLAFTVGVAYLW